MDGKLNNILKSINDLKFTQFKLINTVNNQNNQIKSLIVKIDNIQTKIDSYDVFFSELNIKIDSFSAKITSFTNELNLLNNRVNLLESNMPNLSLKFILGELSERQHRIKNVLLFNLPEPKNFMTLPTMSLLLNYSIF